MWSKINWGSSPYWHIDWSFNLVMKMKMKRPSHLIIGVLFLFFAIVQYDDPDPLAWILIYGAISAISLLSAFGIFNKWVAYLVLSVSMIWMTFLFPGFWHWLRYEPFDALFGSMDPNKMHLEESREFLGLLLGAIGLVVATIQNRK